MKPYFRNLDSLRTIACFSVVFGHCSLIQYHKWVGEGFLGTFIELTGAGHWGVKFFFVLSGFLIAFLVLTEIEDTGRFSIRNFYARRFLRIWPLYYFSLFVGFIAYPYLRSLFGLATPLSYNPLYHLFFLGNFNQIDIHKIVEASDKILLIINISWSVAIEEQFYFVFPLFFIVPFLRKNIAGVLMACIAISILFKVTEKDSIALYSHTLANVFYLGGGCLLAYFSKKERFTSFISHINPYIIAIIYIIGILALMYFPFTHPTLSIWHETFVLCFFGFVIAEQNYALHSPIKYGNIKPLAAMGKYTYGAYLLHPIVKGLAILIQKALHITELTTFQTLYFTFFILLGTCIIAYLSYHYFEMPFLRLKKRFTYVG